MWRCARRTALRSALLAAAGVAPAAGPAITAFQALSAEPMLSGLAAVVASVSGGAVTNSIGILPRITVFS